MRRVHKGKNHFYSVVGSVLVALFEPRISGSRASSVIRKLGFPKSFRVEAHGFSGGIWILWKEELVVQVLQISNQYVHMRVRFSATEPPVFITAVYASPNATLRKYVWDQLFNLNPGTEHAWLWEGISMLSMTLWIEVVVHVADLSHPDFKDILRRVWDKKKSVLDNLQHCQESLISWNSSVFGHIGQRKRQLVARLRGIDKYLASKPSDFLSTLEKTLRTELDLVLEQEEKLWYKKSRCKWYKVDEGLILFLLFEMMRGLVRRTREFTTDCSSNALAARVSYDEVRTALFSMQTIEIAWSDGFHAFFFQQNWDVMGQCICESF
ncbi:hypothetical protein GQ457_07G014860 [Hibiscus cannabinus]